MSIGDVLVELDAWPVDRAAGAFIGGDGRTTHGDPSGVFRLASVSKLLTSYAVAMAVEEGAFGFDDTVKLENYEGDTPPTVRQLLAHAGGVAFGEWAQQKAPETRRIYSSAGYEMLAAFLEAKTGIGFADYCQEGLNEPLGMNVDFSGSAGHGFSGSVDDLAAFAAEVLEPKLLAPETVAEMVSVQYGELGGVVPGYGMFKPCPWGLGFEIHGSKGAESTADAGKHWLAPSMPAEVAGHFGQSGTFLWVAPEHKLAAVVLTDRDFGDWAKPLWAPFNERLWEAAGYPEEPTNRSARSAWPQRGPRRTGYAPCSPPR
ncbi:MAG TPA: beta-lactamase family protein [Candidatus Corynebacterium gallistercoris]|uniref:Beta-lactamase family protein n=1 Tax=Candidatus Corynebacterium gallistercoris TaxID=2838530 RepID=A0A9D1RYX4_9CORY|nr:beta-lactamase family protein [Candidatus Corynebacterium gallistercoris]